ncbi:MAG: isoprenylcysteine carboxylmethyltransferase family protein [Chloroherpetonaceae bacterium]|nr:isoprenylcysteine carboxylmethyltransferase family protein [Chloroherpetonaceae bacterium]
MDLTKEYFLYLIILLAVQRLMELMVSRHNETQLKAKGAIEYGESHYKWMVLLHLGWFVGMITEFILLKPSIFPFWGSLLTFLLFLQIVRYYVIKSLGEFWNTKIIVLPGSRPIQSGIYRFVRHPNYWIVRMEILFFPILFKLYITSIIFTILNVWLLNVRIEEEEKALATLSEK